MRPSTKDRMIQEEIRLCKAFLKKFGALRHNLHFKVEDFVNRCFLLHRDLIERWGDWRYHSDLVQVEDALLPRLVAQQNLESFQRQLGILHREGKIHIWETDPTFEISGYDPGFLPPNVLLSSKILEEQYQTPVEGYDGPQVAKFSQGTRYTLVINKARVPDRLALRIYSTEIRVGQRLSSAVLRYLEDECFSRPYAEAWKKLFQQLGEVAWISTRIPIATTFSCAPSSFLRLGHYGENSCYRNQGEGEYSKLWLAADCPNTFVMLFYRAKDNPNMRVSSRTNRRVAKVAGRAWGIYIPRRGAMIANFYQLPQKMVLPALLECLREAFDFSKPEVWKRKGRTVEQTYGESLNASCMFEYLRDITSYPAAYLNKDVKLVVANQSKVEGRICLKWLAAISKHAVKYGLFTRGGQGPQLYRDLRGNYHLEQPVYKSCLWPYKDVTTAELTDEYLIKHVNIERFKSG